MISSLLLMTPPAVNCGWRDITVLETVRTIPPIYVLTHRAMYISQGGQQGMELIWILQPFPMIPLAMYYGLQGATDREIKGIQQ